jgi:hypothetical protein
VESRGLGDDATPRRPRAREKAGDVRATALGLTWKRRHGDLLGKKMVLRRFWDWAVPDGRAKRERERESTGWAENDFGLLGLEISCDSGRVVWFSQSEFKSVRTCF